MPTGASPARRWSASSSPIRPCKKRLSGALLLRADVTANGAEDRALLRRFHLFGPPTTIFFDAQGNEIEPARLIGYQNTERFLQTLGSAGL